MLAIGNDELAEAPDMPDTFICPRCGLTHTVKYGEHVHEDGTRTPSKLLGFYKCQGEDYLCSINGKDIRK